MEAKSEETAQVSSLTGTNAQLLSEVESLRTQLESNQETNVSK